jgi:hypothetical protein
MEVSEERGDVQEGDKSLFDRERILEEKEEGQTERAQGGRTEWAGGEREGIG